MLRQWMMFRQRQEHRLIEHLKAQQIRIVIGRRLTHQGNIETTLSQALQLLGGAEVIQRDMHIRPIGAQYAQGIGQDSGVHGVFDIADAQATFFAATETLA